MQTYTIVSIFIGINFTLGKYNDGHKAAHYDHDPTIFYGNLSFNFFIDSKVVGKVAYPSSYKAFYDAALMKAVESIFKRDLILYGYMF